MPLAVSRTSSGGDHSSRATSRSSRPTKGAKRSSWSDHSGVNSNHSQFAIGTLVSRSFQPIQKWSSWRWATSTRTPSKSSTTGQSANQLPSSTKRTTAKPVSRRPTSAASRAPYASRTASMPNTNDGSKPVIPILMEGESARRPPEQPWEFGGR